MYYIGVDLGGTNIKTGLMNEEGKIIAKASAKTLGDRAPEEITKDIAGTVSKVIEDAGVSLNDIDYVGVGIPGCVDNTIGKVIETNNMNFNNFEFVKEFRKIIDKPVIMANDANCAVLGEMIDGGAKGYTNIVMITIGTGIGGGFVYNKKIYEGFNGAAMEVGHMVIDKNGRDCNCGRTGCWERYASATALVRITEEYAEKYPDSMMAQMIKEDGGASGITAFKAAKAGDEAGNMVVDEFVENLGAGICNLINIFQPEVILVGGGVSHEGEYLLEKIRKIIEKEVYAFGHIPETVLKKAELGNDAGIIGAGFLGV